MFLDYVINKEMLSMFRKKYLQMNIDNIRLIILSKMFDLIMIVFFEF